MSPDFWKSAKHLVRSSSALPVQIGLPNRPELAYVVCMNVELQPETERMLQRELASGHFESVDEIIIRGIQSRLGNPLSSKPTTRERTKSAVDAIRAARQGNRLPVGLTIRQLIDEGRD